MSAVLACADLRRIWLAFFAFSLLAAFFFLIPARILGERFFKPRDLLIAVALFRLALLADLDHLVLLFRICVRSIYSKIKAPPRRGAGLNGSRELRSLRRRQPINRFAVEYVRLAKSPDLLRWTAALDPGQAGRSDRGHELAPSKGFRIGTPARWRWPR
jgi:hypothetical protein